MQEFFMDYGLWLLVGLLVVIGLVFLLSGKSRSDGAAPPISTETPPAPVIEPRPAPVAPPIVAAPATVAPVEPAPVEAVPVASAPLEPLAFVPEMPNATPETIPVPPPVVATPNGGADDLLRLKGVGPKLQTLLIELGVIRFAQIAAWTDADIATIDARLGNFKGRPVRDQWVDQAKYLAAGDIAGFEAKYGKL
ncbi:MAG: hypothetical protein I8H96_14925 [Sphingomonadaceae bacterium]|nr:hypothetical protein [Sphingomonadaceae bacterium]